MHISLKKNQKKNIIFSNLDDPTFTTSVIANLCYKINKHFNINKIVKKKFDPFFLKKKLMRNLVNL